MVDFQTIYLRQQRRGKYGKVIEIEVPYDYDMEAFEALKASFTNKQKIDELFSDFILWFNEFIKKGSKRSLTILNDSNFLEEG